MRRLSTTLASFCVILFLSACAGPSETTGQNGPSPDAESERAPERVAISEYETFDPSAYPVEPVPTEPGGAVHDVPERLLQSRGGEGVEQTVEGFRVQVFSAQDQEAAQEFREEVRQWWEEKREEDAAPEIFGDDPPIVIEYSQPYYRVRLGGFADRDAAEEALEFVQEKYPGAFIAQGTVTVVR